MTTNNATAEINGVDVSKLRSTIDAVREDRALGEVTFRVNGSWSGGFRLEASTGALTQAGGVDGSRSGKFMMKSDEPAALLGTDTAASPAEYILQALAGCYTVTLAANASARDIRLEGYRLRLEADFDLATFLGIDSQNPAGAREIRAELELDAPDATREELEDLVAAVEARSPIRDTLIRPVEVLTTLI